MAANGRLCKRSLCQRAINTVRSHACRFIVSWPIFIGGILFTLGSACLLYESIMHHPNKASKDVSDIAVPQAQSLCPALWQQAPASGFKGFASCCLPAAQCYAALLRRPPVKKYDVIWLRHLLTPFAGRGL